MGSGAFGQEQSQRRDSSVGDEIDVSRNIFQNTCLRQPFKFHTNVIKYIYCRPSSGTVLPSEQTLVSLVRRFRLLTDAANNSDNNLVVFA